MELNAIGLFCAPLLHKKIDLFIVEKIGPKEFLIRTEDELHGIQISYQQEEENKAYLTVQCFCCKKPVLMLPHTHTCEVPKRIWGIPQWISHEVQEAPETSEVRKQWNLHPEFRGKDLHRFGLDQGFWDEESLKT